MSMILVFTMVYDGEIPKVCTRPSHVTLKAHAFPKDTHGWKAVAVRGSTLRLLIFVFFFCGRIAVPTLIASSCRPEAVWYGTSELLAHTLSASNVLNNKHPLEEC